jgi:hypothetical protein
MRSPAHEQVGKAVVPGVGALHDPATWHPGRTREEVLLPTPTDVRRDPARSNRRFGVLVVVPLVEAEVLGPPWATRRSSDHWVERLADKPLVVDVGAGDLGCQRNAPAVSQDVTLGAAVRSIRWVGAGEPPLGAFTMALSSEDHFYWIPPLRS